MNNSSISSSCVGDCTFLAVSFFILADRHMQFISRDSCFVGLYSAQMHKACVSSVKRAAVALHRYPSRMQEACVSVVNRVPEVVCTVAGGGVRFINDASHPLNHRGSVCFVIYSSLA